MKRGTVSIQRLLLLLLLTTFAAQAAWGARIGFDPGDQTVEVGDLPRVDLVVSELEGEIVSAYDLDILYDPSIVRATRVAFNDALGSATFLEALNDFSVAAPGIVDLAQISLLSDSDLLAEQGGDRAILGTIFFEAVAPGTTSLDFVLDATNDIKGRNGLILATVAESGSIQVLDGPAGAVPEPSAALLFLVGGGVAAASIRPRSA